MTYRVIQWATGAIGKTCLRQIIDHPDLELVGLYTYSPQKEGRDAGEIARRAPTGVKATRDIEEILALDADCVIHNPREGEHFNTHNEDVIRLLRSGKNVISTVMFTYPHAHEPEHLQSLEAACREGNSTLFGTGINPGFIVERIAVGLTGACCNVQSLRVREVYDCSPVVSPGFIFEQCRMGSDPEQLRAGSSTHELFTRTFAEVIRYVGDQLGVKYDGIEADHEFCVAPHDVHCRAGVIPKGTVANIRWRWHGIVDGKRFFTIEMVWLIDRTLPGWDYDDGWEIEIEGAPGMHVRIDLKDPVGMPDRSKAIQYAVAGPCIRAIPVVCAAPPGVLVVPSFAPWTPRMPRPNQK